jgi:tripartite ATP-independent transporter DctP family solute receptor
MGPQVAPGLTNLERSLSKMKRAVGAFLVCMVLLLCLACSGSGAGSPAHPSQPQKEVYRMKMAFHVQPDSPSGQGCTRIAERLNSAYDGRFDVTVYPAEQLGSEKSVFEQLSEGVTEMSGLGFGVIGSMAPSVLAAECGYMFRDYDHLQKFLKSGIFEEIKEDAIKKAGVRMAAVFYSGVRHTTTSSKPIRGPADMKGMKIRVPNGEMLLATFQAMGASPTPMALSEVFMALQNGTVDGEENPATHITTNKFYEVQKYLNLTGHMIQGSTISISEKCFQKFPADIQQILLKEFENEASYLSKYCLDIENRLIADLRDKYGMEIIQVDKEAFAKLMPPVIGRFEERWGIGLYERIQAIK